MYVEPKTSLEFPPMLLTKSPGPIEMQKFNYNDENGTIDIEGRFFLEWLPGGTQWKRNSGKIFMKLQDGGTSFKISELSYYGDQRKKSR